jgi:phosphatidylinositol alpha 1,6-mannosyltransferase
MRLVIAGDGPDRKELEARFRDHPVTFLGRVEGEQLASTYAAMDVFVHCGTEETFGQTLQEAHATGVPVVAPNRGGPRHIVTSGVNGFLVDPTEWGSFCRAVEVLKNDAHLLHAMSRAARASVADKTWEANNQQLLHHYRAAVWSKNETGSLLAA